MEAYEGVQILDLSTVHTSFYSKNAAIQNQGTATVHFRGALIQDFADILITNLM